MSIVAAKAAEKNTVEQAFNNIGAKKGTNALAEGIGELGMVHWQNLFSVHTHPDFIPRYHGPDGIAVMIIDGKPTLVGLEAKSSNKKSTEVNKHEDGSRQQSKAANLKRAEQMLKKMKRKGWDGPSTRIGQDYTQAEMALYQQLKDNDGKKPLVSVHTHIPSGEATIIMRNEKGKIMAELGEFTIPDYETKKEAIQHKLNTHKT